MRGEALGARIADIAALCGVSEESHTEPLGRGFRKRHQASHPLQYESKNAVHSHPSLIDHQARLYGNHPKNG
jgi:hypothetical protein